MTGEQKDKRQWWYFTFGYGQKYTGHYVKFCGTFSEAREKMIAEYGLDWGLQYSEALWKEWVQKCIDGGRESWLETELK